MDKTKQEATRTVEKDLEPVLAVANENWGKFPERIQGEISGYINAVVAFYSGDPQKTA